MFWIVKVIITPIVKDGNEFHRHFHLLSFLNLVIYIILKFYKPLKPSFVGLKDSLGEIYPIHPNKKEIVQVFESLRNL